MDCLNDEQIEELLQQAEQRAIKSGASNKAALIPRPAATTTTLPAPYMKTDGHVASVDAHRFLKTDDKQSTGNVRKLDDPVAARQQKIEEKRATAGKDWFNLPATDMTSELKRDLQVLSMRNILDPKRHYKKSKNSLPQFSQVGILKEGATEFYSARIPNSQRNRSLVEEVLAGERETGRFKRKYDEVQATKRSGKKGHYKSLMAKKYGKNLRQ